MFGKIDTSNLASQLNSLKDLDVKPISKVGAEVIFDRSQELVPVDTGELKESGDVVETGDGYAVEYTANHAIPVEFGTSNMRAQSYLRRAIDESQKEVLEAMAEEAEKGISQNV